MPQLNVHIPASSDLLVRVDEAARRLGTTPSALARVVLEVALEPYVQTQLELRQQEREYSAQVVTALHHRFSGALPARPFVDADELEQIDTPNGGHGAGHGESAPAAGQALEREVVPATALSR